MKVFKKHKLLGIYLLGFLCIGIVGLISLYRGKQTDHQKQIIMKEQVQEFNRLQKKKNVTGITELTLDGTSLEYSVQVFEREINSKRKECLVVEIESVNEWNKLGREKRIEIMKGLINTSRLQIDKNFGCAIIESRGSRISTGLWQNDSGYVII